MEYDVTGTLKIDTESFEQALKDAQERINKFKKDLDSLKNVAKDLGLKSLDKDLKDVDKLLDNIKGDFGKVDKSADNVTKSVKNLKKETNGAKESIKTLDEYFNQATNSANKLGAENKKNTKNFQEEKKQIQSLTNDVKKTTTSFSEMDKATSSSVTKINNKIGDLDTRLKKAYGSLHEYYEEFNALNSRMIKNGRKLEQIYSFKSPTSWLPARAYEQNLREPQMGYDYHDLRRTRSNDHFKRILGDVRRDYPMYDNAYLENKDIMEGLIINKRTLEEELKYINELERELGELKQEKESLMSSSTGADKLVYELEAPIRKVKELKREMNTLFKKNISEMKGIPKTFKDVSLKDSFLADKEELGKMKVRFREIFEEMNTARNKIKETLNKLVNDYGISMEEISSLTGGLFDPKILTEGLSEAVIGIDPVLKDLEKKIKTTKNKISKIQKEAMNGFKRLTEDSIRSNKKGLSDYLPRKKDGSYYNNNRVNKKLEEFMAEGRYRETYKLDEFNKLKGELESLEREFEILSKEKNKFFDENSYTASGLKSNIELIRGELQRTKIALRSAVSSVKYNRQNASEHEEGSYWNKRYTKDVESGMKKVKSLRDQYRAIKSELQGMEAQYDILKNKQNSVWRIEQLEPFIQMMTQVVMDTNKATESVKKMDSEIDSLSFDDKMKQQFDGLNQMLVETGQMSVEQARMFGTEIVRSLDNANKKANEITKNIRGRMNLFYKNFGGKSGKWFTEPSPYGQETSRWIHDQLSTTRDFFKGFTQGFARLKKEQSESVTWMNELKVKMDELKYSSRDFINTEVFAKAKVEAEKYMATLDKMRRRLGLIEKYQYQPTGNKVGVGFAGSSEYQQAVEGLKKMEMQANKTAEAYARLKAQYKPEFNQFSAGFLGDANIQKDIQLVNEFNRVTREVSASTNQWVNQEITDFNRFSQAVQKSITKTREEMQLLNSSFKKAGNMSGVGFAGTNQFQAINKGMQEYNRLSNLANLNTNRMGLGFEKFGQYSKKAESNVRSLGGVLRTLRTTMSMIGGMFVWEFAFKIMDATKATISAKSEMESYYKTLNMGSTEIASFNNMLDKTVNKFQKMNKFQLGETISALGVEFKMSTDEMNQVMKVAPMIVNEYLRAGRSTEEAILAIKDISQGEFLRLSRETGVGAKEIKEAGWSGDNKDIISLYKALEKIGTARHWDVFAQKAQSLNDVMLITENRMTEFATLVSDAITPVIVGSFNALGDAFNSASRWYEGLPVADKIWVQIATLGTVGLTTAGVFNSHLLPAIQNFGMNLVSSFLGVDSAVAKEKGLAQAIAHETAVERIANIERTNGQRVLHAKIMTLKEEELANKLGMSTTKLKTRYEALQSVAYKRTGDSLKAKELAQRSLIMAEEQNITTTQAMNILLEEEALAEMGTFKALIVRKLGLDANTVSEQGMIVALNERLAQSFPYITSLVSETFATLGLESATATLVATLGLLIAPLIAIGVALAPLIIQFAELQGSYEKVADTLTAGQDRIDSYKEKQKSLQKTVDELSAKNNRTVDEEKKLESSRKKLTNTTTALKRAEEELKYARQVEGGYSEWSDQLEANRYNNAKKINEEYQKQTGLSEEVTDSTYGMSKAYKDMTEHMQTANWLENHRNDRFAELSNNLKNTTSSQEEYNQKLKQFGKDWNQVYDDMEDAQMRMADPNADTWGRLMATLDYDMALAKKDWIEFWSDPLGSIAYMTNFDGLSQGFNSTLTEMGQAWDDFWKPISDFFNGLSVDGDFDPFAGLKQSWGDANAWLDSLLPDISVDSIKQWFGKNVREPLQQAISDFMKNPFGGDSNGASGGASGGAKGGASPSKSFDLKSLFKFDFSSLRTSFTNGFRTVFNKVPNVMQTAGKLWSSISKNNGLKSVNSLKDGLSAVKTTVSDKFHQGANTIRGFIGTFKSHASSVGKGVHNSMKTGVGDLASNIRSKLNAMKKAIDGMKERIVSSAKSIASGITGAFDGISLPSFGFGGFYGFRGTRRSSPSRTRIRGRHAHVYGSPTSNMSFETALKGMLTAQGFRRPSSYQFYPNSRKSTQQTWADGTANCFDGAKLIVALGKMFGLKSHIVTGNWNGMGHAGAVVGGKLYDMTQFQRKGVFRGTSGVHFGSRSHGASYGNTKNETNKTVNLYVTNDLSNARIYGIDDLDAHIKRTSEKTYYELHSPNSAIGY